MKTADAINHFESQKKLSEALKADGWPASQQAISNWGEYPPPGRQRQIEAMTNGALKADSENLETPNDIQRPKAS